MLMATVLFAVVLIISGFGGISGETFDWLRDEEPLKGSCLFPLTSESKTRRFFTGAGHRTASSVRRSAGWEVADFATWDVCRQRALLCLLPGKYGSITLGLFAEYKAKEYVDAANGKEKECGNEREIIDVVGEHSSSDQALNDTKSTETKVFPKDGEETVKEDCWPSEFGEKEHDDLADDEKAIHDGPENASRLIRKGAVFDIITV